jgi:hypothetical protein
MVNREHSIALFDQENQIRDQVAEKNKNILYC